MATPARFVTCQLADFKVQEKPISVAIAGPYTSEAAILIATLVLELIERGCRWLQVSWRWHLTAMVPSRALRRRTSCRRQRRCHTPAYSSRELSSSSKYNLGCTQSCMATERC